MQGLAFLNSFREWLRMPTKFLMPMFVGTQMMTSFIIAGACWANVVNIELCNNSLRELENRNAILEMRNQECQNTLNQKPEHPPRWCTPRTRSTRCSCTAAMAWLTKSPSASSARARISAASTTTRTSRASRWGSPSSSSSNPRFQPSSPPTRIDRRSEVFYFCA